LLTAAGIIENEIDEITEIIREQHPTIRNLGAWLDTIAGKGDLAAVVDQARIERDRRRWPTERDAFAATLTGHPPCVHDIEGGDIPKPGGLNPGWMVCVGCRIAAKRSA
jgi:hypothetical protein